MYLNTLYNVYDPDNPLVTEKVRLCLQMCLKTLGVFEAINIYLIRLIYVASVHCQRKLLYMNLLCK